MANSKSNRNRRQNKGAHINEGTTEQEQGANEQKEKLSSVPVNEETDTQTGAESETQKGNSEDAPDAEEETEDASSVEDETPEDSETEYFDLDEVPNNRLAKVYVRPKLAEGECVVMKLIGGVATLFRKEKSTRLVELSFYDTLNAEQIKLYRQKKLIF